MERAVEPVMESPLAALVTADGYVSAARSSHAAAAADLATLEQFSRFLELRLRTENLAMLRRMFADFLLGHERSVAEFEDLAASMVVLTPFSQRSVRRRLRAAALLNAPKRPLAASNCVFDYLAQRLQTRNMELLKRMFQQFVGHDESLLREFVAKGEEVVSVLPWCKLKTTAGDATPTQPAAQEPTQGVGVQESTTYNADEPRVQTNESWRATKTDAGPVVVKGEGRPTPPTAREASYEVPRTAGTVRPPTVMRKRGRPPKNRQFPVQNQGPSPTSRNQKQEPSVTFKAETRTADAGPPVKTRSRRRRGDLDHYELPPRPPGKRQVKMPESFAAEQASDVMAKAEQ